MPDRVAQLLGVLALAAVDRFRSAADGALGRGGAHSGALVHLDAHPGESVQGLAAVLGVSHPAAVKIADRLTADGLIERRVATDGRVRELHPTASGRRMAAEVLAGRAGALGDVLAVLDPGERESLERLLERLVAGLAEDRAAALTVCRLCDRAACCGEAAGCPMQHTV